MDSDELRKLANHLRMEAVRMVYEGKDGHPGPALSIADIITVLYFDIMRIDPKNPDWEDRDRLILSKGHACPILYAALNERGFFGERITHFNLRALGSIFQGHPVMKKTPGVDMTSGSLGNGVAIGAGMALGGKLQHKDYKVYVIVGDGELEEGVIWEGVNVAAAKKLDNLIVFVDQNGWQSSDTVKNIIGSNNIKERFQSFCWDTQQIDGHDIDAIKAAIDTIEKHQGKPHVIICNDIKGKGLDYMENNNSWHKGVPSEGQYMRAVEQLEGVAG